MASVSTQVSLIDPDYPVYKYQRIEEDGLFGPFGKAESAHLMPKSHCHGTDDNNRLALSREMHGAYDALGFASPVLNIEVASVSKEPVFDNKYQVELVVSVFSRDYTFLLGRLKTGSTNTSEPLVMNFSSCGRPPELLHVPEWKSKKAQELRDSYFAMTSAVM